jgi:hypothetical protein
MLAAKLLIAALLAITLSGHCSARDCSPPDYDNRIAQSRFRNESQSTCHNLLDNYFKFEEPPAEVPQDWDQARTFYLQAIAQLMKRTDFKLEDRKNYLYFIQLYKQIIDNDKLWNLMIALEADLARIDVTYINQSFCAMPQTLKEPHTVSDSNQQAGFINSFCSKFSFGIDRLLETFDGENYCRIAKTQDDCASITQAKKDDYRVKFNGCTMRYVLLAQTEMRTYLDFGTNGVDYADQHLDNYMKCLSRFVMPAVWPVELKRYFYFHAAVLIKPVVLLAQETEDFKAYYLL